MVTTIKASLNKVSLMAKDIIDGVQEFSLKEILETDFDTEKDKSQWKMAFIS